MNRAKEQRELSIFRSFLECCGLDLDPGAISQPKPPEPDILCCTTSGTWIAFELVELVDESIKRNLAIAFDEIPVELQRAVAQLEPEQRRHFQTKYQDRNVGVQVDDDLSASLRKRLPNTIVKILLDDRYVPDGDGVLHRAGHPNFPPGLRYIHLTPTYSELGPTFDQVAYGSYADQSSKWLRRKLDARTYSSAHAMELLAYYEDGFAPNDLQIQELGELITSLISQSHFERVWLFDRPKGRVLGHWSRPPE